MESFKLVKQGAEAKLFIGTYLGKPTIAKERFVKAYRHPHLDANLSKERTKAESRAIVRCKLAGIRTPTLYLVDLQRRILFMEYFECSMTVKDYINSSQMKFIDKLSENIGLLLGKMHKHNIIHGDLTSSNILLVNKNNVNNFNNIEDLDLVVIDFGLAHIDTSTEDKGVDLYVLERALLSTHLEAELMFPTIMKGYQHQNKTGYKEVFTKYEEVRARGRKRTMVG